jgi:hypothetical protein
MASIQRAVQTSGRQSTDAGSHEVSNDRPHAQPFTRVASTPRDRAIESLDGLCQDISSRLGPEPFNFPVQGGQGILSRLGPNVIVCSGTDDFYVEIVNGRITSKNGQSDSQIAAFLGAAKTALG